MKALLIGLVLVFSVGLSCSDSNSGSNDGNSDGFGGTENFALYGIGIDGTFESVWNCTPLGPGEVFDLPPCLCADSGSQRVSLVDPGQAPPDTGAICPASSTCMPATAAPVVDGKATFIEGGTEIEYTVQSLTAEAIALNQIVVKIPGGGGTVETTCTASSGGVVSYSIR